MVQANFIGGLVMRHYSLAAVTEQTENQSGEKAGGKNPVPAGENYDVKIGTAADVAQAH